MTKFIDFWLVDSLFTLNCMKIAAIIMVSLSDTAGEKMQGLMGDSWIVQVSKIIKMKSIDVLVQNAMEEILKEAVSIINVIVLAWVDWQIYSFLKFFW